MTEPNVIFLNENLGYLIRTIPSLDEPVLTAFVGNNSKTRLEKYYQQFFAKSRNTWNDNPAIFDDEPKLVAAKWEMILVALENDWALADLERLAKYDFSKDPQIGNHPPKG